MSEVSTPAASAVTIALIVVLGIFVYPWLLAQRRGRWIVALLTLMLAALFIFFQGSRSGLVGLALAAWWALGPVIAGVIVCVFNAKTAEEKAMIGFRIAAWIVLATSALATAPLAAQSFDQLSGRDATAGLKAALDSGAAAAVASLGRTDGFWANPKVRIPLPEHLQRARAALRMIGRGQEVDALELAVNRAAEQAVPQAKTLLVNAVKSMSVDDAKQILRDGDDSVTQFFKAKTAPQLTERFLPIVRRVTEKNGLAQQYNALAGQGAAFGLIKPEQASVERYVTQKALDGLYTMIAEEERKIRANPLAAGQDIIRRVFGALNQR